MISFRKQQYLLFLSLIIGFFAFFPPKSAIAQENLSATSPEDIAIAFYKTGKTIPDFVRWIEETEPYSTTPKARRAAVMEQQMQRLQSAYQNFDADENHIIIKTAAYLIPEITKTSSGQNTYKLNVSFDDKTDVFYFPYEFMGQRIMVMPEKFHILTSTDISEMDYNRLNATTHEKRKMPFILRLKAIKSDLTRPHMVHGINQWAFTTEVVSMESWDHNGALLWEYTAPWYVSPKTEKIQKLYDERDDDTLYLRDVKSLQMK